MSTALEINKMKLKDFATNAKYKTPDYSKSKFKCMNGTALYFNPDLETHEIIAQWCDDELCFINRPKAIQAKRLQVMLFTIAKELNISIVDDISLGLYIKNKRWA